VSEVHSTHIGTVIEMLRIGIILAWYGAIQITAWQVKQHCADGATTICDQVLLNVQTFLTRTSTTTIANCNLVEIHVNQYRVSES